MFKAPKDWPGTKLSDEGISIVCRASEPAILRLNDAWKSFRRAELMTFLSPMLRNFLCVSPSFRNPGNVFCETISELSETNRPQTELVLDKLWSTLRTT